CSRAACTAASRAVRPRRQRTFRSARGRRRRRWYAARSLRTGAGTLERTRSSTRAAVDAERPEREVLRVQVVLEHEHAREAGPVPEGIRPRAVRPLRVEEVL